MRTTLYLLLSLTYHADGKWAQRRWFPSAEKLSLAVCSKLLLCGSFDMKTLIYNRVDGQNEIKLSIMN